MVWCSINGRICPRKKERAIVAPGVGCNPGVLRARRKSSTYAKHLARVFNGTERRSKELKNRGLDSITVGMCPLTTHKHALRARQSIAAGSSERN